MAGIDPSREFIPLGIAVLTVSDTRSFADDRSGATLVERIETAGHRLGRARDRHRRCGKNPHAGPRWIADAGVDVVITTGGTGIHRPRRDARGGRAAVREAHGRLRHALSSGQRTQDRHLGDPDPRHGRRRRRDLRILPAGFARCLQGRLGRDTRRTNSTTATGPAISSRSCRASTSICAATRPRAGR